MVTRLVVAFALALVACGPSGPEGRGGAKGPASSAAAECPRVPPEAVLDRAALDAAPSMLVRRTCVYGVEGEERARVEGALRLRAGQRLDPAVIRGDVHALMSWGRFDDVAVSGVSTPAGALVFYAVAKRTALAEVVFEGAKVLVADGLQPKLTPDGNHYLSMAKVYQAMTMMRDEYRRRGYRRVAIDASTTPTDDGARVTVNVVEGPQSTIGEIGFKGAARPREAELRKLVELDAGAPFDEEKIRRAAARIQDFYLDRGFINALVQPSFDDVAAGGATPVSFTVVEGDAYRFGTVKLGKHEGLVKLQRVVKLRSQPGAPYSPSAVHDDVQLLTQELGARGRESVVIPKRELDPKTRKIDVVFEATHAPL